MLVVVYSIVVAVDRIKIQNNPGLLNLEWDKNI